MRAAGVFAALFLAHPPRSQALFLAALLLVAAGEALRMWTAGHPLVPKGPYLLSRNPRVLGSLLLACGFCLMCASARHWLSTAVLWAATAFLFRRLYAGRLLAEGELRAAFGPGFEAWRSSVPGLLPGREAWPRAWATSSFDWSLAMRSGEGRALWAVLGLALLLRFKMAYRL
jgi:protein-S-isoprenylcysteine O-methyltransferase Ste14